MKPTPAIIADDIHKAFGIVKVLKGVSLTAHNGDVISIVGSSGSGKSTFLRCINFLETPDSGRVVIAGEEIKVKTDRSGRLVGADSKQIDRLRTQLGMVFQSFNLRTHMTVLENVMESPLHVLKRTKQEVHDEAMAMLKRLGFRKNIAVIHLKFPAGSSNVLPSLAPFA